MAKWFKHETFIYQISTTFHCIPHRSVQLYNFLRIAAARSKKHQPQKLIESHFEIDNLPNFTINCDFIFKCLLLEKLDLKYAVCIAVKHPVESHQCFLHAFKHQMSVSQL